MHARGFVSTLYLMMQSCDVQLSMYHLSCIMYHYHVSLQDVQKLGCESNK